MEDYVSFLEKRPQPPRFYSKRVKHNRFRNTGFSTAAVLHHTTDRVHGLQDLTQLSLDKTDVR
jgi:hypothetical protein